MIRGFTLVGVLLLAGAVPALAQAHPPHTRPHPHDSSGHVPLDSAQHAVLHALLHGTWTGTMSHHGVSSGLDLSVAHDSLRRVMLKMSTRDSLRAGAAHDFVTHGDTLRWTQDVSGAPCKTMAVLGAPTLLVPEMRGTMACERGAITFTLRKKTG